jgi:hypothetical protein
VLSKRFSHPLFAHFLLYKTQTHTQTHTHTYTHIGENMLHGTIPTEIGNLSRLTKLDFNLNTLEGTIPTEIGNMAALTVLGLCKFPCVIFLHNLTNISMSLGGSFLHLPTILILILTIILLLGMWYGISFGFSTI